MANVTIVKLQCFECLKFFMYKKRGNVLKKFCVSCTKTRNALAKVRFRKEDVNRKSSHEDEIAALEILQGIPDREISINRMFNLISRAAT